MKQRYKILLFLSLTLNVIGLIGVIANRVSIYNLSPKVDSNEVRSKTNVQRIDSLAAATDSIYNSAIKKLRK